MLATDIMQEPPEAAPDAPTRQFVNLTELDKLAEDKMRSSGRGMGFDYYYSGSETQSTLVRSTAACFSLRPNTVSKRYQLL